MNRLKLATMSTFPADAFKDLTDANAEYIKSFKYSELTGVAQRGLAIVTCMDSRINRLLPKLMNSIGSPAAFTPKLSTSETLFAKLKQTLDPSEFTNVLNRSTLGKRRLVDDFSAGHARFRAAQTALRGCQI